MPRSNSAVVVVAALLSPMVLARTSLAATISVGPSDSYDKIEAAQAGDEVVIAPGTYGFRVYLTNQGTAENPIVIRAQDPTRPPVWDLSNVLVENAPGSYTAGDRTRGCWQISGGSYYRISGIVFKGCHSGNAMSSGLRYYNGTKGILLRDCVFRGSDNGLTGGSQDSEITVEYSEFDSNGTNLAPTRTPSHNIYVYGGLFTLRYSYVHDPVQAQNFHVRATTAVLEYNWFARAKSYEGDLMTSDDLSDPSSITQSMLLRGNVFIQSAQPNNNSQVIAIFNDAGISGLSFSARLVNNTFVGNGGHAALVHLSNADGTTMKAELFNNIVAGTSVVTLTEDSAHGVVSGSNNWIVTGASAPGLSASISGSSPGFVDAETKDYRLASGSGAIGKAIATSDLPASEYYRDEVIARESRSRSSAQDLGAFESTTASVPVGPYGPVLPVDAATDAPSPSDSAATPDSDVGDGDRREAGSAGGAGGSGAGGAGGAGGRADAGIDGPRVVADAAGLPDTGGIVVRDAASGAEAGAALDAGLLRPDSGSQAADAVFPGRDDGGVPSLSDAGRDAWSPTGADARAADSGSRASDARPATTSASSGCSCSVGGRREHGGALTIVAAFVAWGLRRKRRALRDRTQ